MQLLFPSAVIVKKANRRILEIPLHATSQLIKLHRHMNKLVAIKMVLLPNGTWMLCNMIERSGVSATCGVVGRREDKASDCFSPHPLTANIINIDCIVFQDVWVHRQEEKREQPTGYESILHVLCRIERWFEDVWEGDWRCSQGEHFRIAKKWSRKLEHTEDSLRHVHLKRGRFLNGNKWN